MIDEARRIVAVGLIVMPFVAQAHAYLFASEPNHRALLEAAPTRLKLQFSEPIETGFVKLALKRNGQPVTESLRSRAEPDKKTLVIESTAAGAGDYLLDWSIVARDGHPTRGQLQFTVKPR